MWQIYFKVLYDQFSYLRDKKKERKKTETKGNLILKSSGEGHQGLNGLKYVNQGYRQNRNIKVAFFEENKFLETPHTKEWVVCRDRSKSS